MKTLIKFAVVPLFMLSACTSTNQLSSTYDDDGVYSSKKEKPVHNIIEKKNIAVDSPKSENYKETTPNSYNSNEKDVDKSQMSYDKYKQNQAQSANTVIDNSNAQSEEANNQENQNYSSYDADDYYDYGYSSRIRRFHSPCHLSGYYDDYYTNMYWYNNDPFYYGTSIYMGYNWWGPSYSYYNPYQWNNWGLNIGFGYGWGYYGGGYYGWNTPYWGGGYYGHGFYGHGYNHHDYNDGYWTSNNNNYNHSSSSYFGPRNSIGSSNGTTTPRGTGTSNGGAKSTDPNQRISAVGNASKITNIGASDKKTTTDAIRNTGIAPNSSVIKAIDNKVVSTSKDNRATTTPSIISERKVDVVNTKTDNQNNTRNYTTPTIQSNPNTRINNYQRYSRTNQEKQIDKPINTTPNTYNYREPKPYNTPSYSQPRSSQEFETPKYKSERNFSTTPEKSQPSNYQEPRSNPNNNNSNRNYNTPSNNQNRNYTPPVNQNRNYTPPTNNENRNYTPPANNENRNYSQPSNNNAPSRSTYTAPPSNSGSNNSGSRSSGSSSGSESQKRR